MSKKSARFAAIYKMKILQISLAFPKSGVGGIDADLANALAKNGHDVTVVVLDSDATDEERLPRKVGLISMLRVKTGRVFNVGYLKKGLTFLSIPHVVRREIAKHLGGREFDLILFEAPPVTLWPVVKWAMARFKCPSFLMQKDIFPQNAVDLGAFGRRSLLYIYFRRQEKMMLKTATRIGCMSRGNVEYILKHNPWLPRKKVVLFPNTCELRPVAKRDRAAFEKSCGIPENACVFLFSGNMGKPQNVPFLCSCMEKLEGGENAYFAAIGSGTESGYVKEFIEKRMPRNGRFFQKLPIDEYNRLAANCDVGIVSLDPRYTIPNYPSKTLSYMELSMPILASTDMCTDYRNLIEDEAVCGLWSPAGDAEKFVENARVLAGDSALRERLGRAGREYLEKHFDVSMSVKILEDFMAVRP